MRIRVAVAAAVTVLSSLALASAAAAAQTARPLVRPAPSWYTPQLHAQVLRAGANGVKVSSEALNIACPGFQQAGVSAGGCIVSPSGCTANFIFTGGKDKYIGTARHCVERVGGGVTMQVDTVTVAEVGTVVKVTPGKCPDNFLGVGTGPGCDVGHDFALIKLYKSVVKKWGINPALPVGGPMGVYNGCDPQAVKYWGHGYEAVTAQGKPEGGLATNWKKDGYGWTGVGFGGDSGSGVVLAANNRAAGNFTHAIVHSGYPGSNLAGMRATAILQLVGSGIRLMNADGSTSSSRSANCRGALGGGLSQSAGPVGDAGQVVEDAGQAVDNAGESVAETGEEVEEAGDEVEDAVDKVGDTVRGAL